MRMKHNGGFTLVEMLVTVAIGSMITLAATSLLLLGLRIHHQSNITAAQQNTVAMFANVMDAIASENVITVVPDGDSWDLKCNNASKIKYNGSTLTLNGTPFLSDVTKATAVMANDLLTIYIKTEHSEYTFSVYCRVAAPPQAGEGGA